MTRRSQLAPSRGGSSSVRWGTGGQSPGDTAWPAVLLPAFPGPRRPTVRLVTPPVPLPGPPLTPPWPLASP
jgi:hypothetical protein